MGARLGRDDVRVRVAGDRVGLVVDARDARAHGQREGVLVRGDRQLVHDDAVERALLLRVASEVGELALRPKKGQAVARA